MAVQKKQSVVPPSQGPLSTRTVQSQRRASPPQTAKENGVYVKSSPQKAPCPVYKSEHIPATSRTVTGQNGLNVDERLKAARERREEQQKIIASREKNRLEREQRAKQHYELQLQERKKRLLEQRHREESRRAAVEEKRKQRLQEEKERYESAVRKTLEKSQRAQQNSQNRGRKPTKSNVPRQRPLTTWEKNLVRRLLTPTCSYLNRSKSAGCQGTVEQVVHVCRRAVSYHSTTTTNTITTSTHHKPQPRPPASPRPKNLQMRSTTVPQVKAARVDSVNKKSRNHSFNAKFPGANPSPQTTTQKESRVATSSPERSPRKSIRRHSAPQPPELPPVPEEEVGAGLDAPCPGNKRPVRTIRAVRTSGEGRTVKICEDYIIEAPRSSLSAILETQETSRTDGDGSPSQVPPCPVRRLPEIEPKPSAGTSDPEEAARVLAEKRREARLQREQEQQEGLQREEEERRNREALERRKAEERAQQQAEVQRLIEEKRRREEEEQRRAEEERAQALREAQLLQKQREEEQARERVRAEQLKQEREQLAQKEEVERQARKKRLEEIMKRTRRTDSPDTKPVSVRISAQPKENTQPVSSSTIEEAVKVVTKPTSLGLHSDDEGVPVVAFKERRSLRTLTGLDEIQSQQRAEVI
ncbi:ensconsin isoform X1 [Periophthalmus magnuspinnatus]|uniref:ensconsin isoform X1 n=1 Tax=Periophthalmus magnuspinnatus TaxID=409849 RepID=UPI00145A734F|nr:ensconsin isoform X1 [Periophthalmus magnuspinnatus]